MIISLCKLDRKFEFTPINTTLQTMQHFQFCDKPQWFVCFCIHNNVFTHILVIFYIKRFSVDCWRIELFMGFSTTTAHFCYWALCRYNTAIKNTFVSILIFFFTIKQVLNILISHPQHGFSQRFANCFGVYTSCSVTTMLPWIVHFDCFWSNRCSKTFNWWFAKHTKSTKGCDTITMCSSNSKWGCAFFLVAHAT